MIDKSPKVSEMKDEQIRNYAQDGDKNNDQGQNNNGDNDDNLTDMSNEEENKSQPDLNADKSKQKILTSDSPGFESLSLFDQIAILENESDFVELIQLSDGDSFGELALINNSPRMATIV